MIQGLGISKVLNMSPSAMFRALGSPKPKPKSPKTQTRKSAPRVVVIVSPPPLRRQKSLPKARNEKTVQNATVQNVRNKVNSQNWRNKAGKAYKLYKELVGTPYNKNRWVNMLANSHVNHAKKKAASTHVKLGMRHAMAGKNVNYIPASRNIISRLKNLSELNKALHNLH